MKCYLRLANSDTPIRKLWCLPSACLVEWTARSPREVQQRADEVVALSNEHDFPTWLGWGMTYRGWSLTALRQEREGLTLLTKGANGIACYGNHNNDAVLAHVAR